MIGLVVPRNVDKYNLDYLNGYDKKYPNLDLVRLERWYFQSQPGTVLDYGCGTGSDILHLLECGYRVVGMDAATESIKLVTSKLEAQPMLRNRATLHLIDSTHTQLPLDDESCDYVICLSVLSLLETQGRISQLITDFRRVLKPGGKMILDINGPASDFAQKGRFVSDDTFEYFLRPGQDEPLRCYCPRTKEVFAGLLDGFLIDDLGHVAFEYLGHHNFEFIACIRKPAS